MLSGNDVSCTRSRKHAVRLIRWRPPPVLHETQQQLDSPVVYLLHLEVAAENVFVSTQSCLSRAVRVLDALEQAFQGCVWI